MNNKLKNEVMNITKGIFVFNILVILVLAVSGIITKEIVTGLVFGSIIAVLNLRLLGISIEKSVDMPPAKSQIYLSSQYMIRMAIVAVVLFASAKATHINVISVALGLVSTKFVILTNKLIIQKIKRKEA